MQKLNDSPNSPLRYVTEDSQTIGQFYNSWDGLYHLAHYEPYRSPPREYLCKKTGNFAPSRTEPAEHKFCAACREQLKLLAEQEGSTVP